MVNTRMSGEYSWTPCATRVVVLVAGFAGITAAAGCKGSTSSASADASGSAAAASSTAPARKDRFPAAWRRSYFRNFEPAKPNSKFEFEQVDRVEIVSLGSNMMSWKNDAPLEVTVACEDEVCTFKSEGVEGRAERTQDSLVLSLKPAEGDRQARMNTARFSGTWSAVDPRKGASARPSNAQDEPGGSRPKPSGETDEKQACHNKCTMKSSACIIRCGDKDECKKECLAKMAECAAECP